MPEVVEAVEEQVAEAVEIEEPVLSEEEEVEEEEEVADIDDLSTSIFERQAKEEPKKKKGKIVVVSPVTEAEGEEKSTSRRGRSYVFDEVVGEVIVKRKRKGSRRREDWEDFDQS